MFSSIFGKKKTSPDTPPEEADPIPAHDAVIPSNGNDEFIFVDRKDPGPPNPLPATNIYPSNPFGGYQPPNLTRQNTAPVPYVQGVPFKLSPELCTNDTFETTQFEVDGILALMTRQLQFNDDYDFSLERGLVEQ